MKTTTSSILAVAGLVSTVSAHGLLTSPAPRMPGAANKAACGTQVNNQDKNGNIQGILQVAKGQSDFDASKCNVWLCKGWQYADNTANVQKYTAGQVVPMTFNVAAPHTGVANVSIVDTATNTMIGSPLISYSDFASNSHTIPANNTAFSITIPNLNGKCTTAGECVIQHYWNAASIDQTYESCVDFTVGGGSGSGGAAAAPAPSSSAAAAGAAGPASSSAAAPAPAKPNPTTLSTMTSTAAVSTTTAAAAVATTSAAATTAAGGYGVSTKAMPSGTTLNDLLAWFKIVLNEQPAKRQLLKKMLMA